MSLFHFLDMVNSRGRMTQPYGRIMALITPLLTLTFVIGLVSFQLLHFTFVEASTQGDLAAVTGTLTPLIAQSRLDKAADSRQQLALAIGLRPRNQTALEHALQDILTPRAGLARQFLTSEQYSQQFSPTEKSYTQVRHFLEHGGLKITHTYGHRLLLEASGTAAQVEQLFHIKINIYTDRDGQSYYANSTDPVLPGPLASQVLSINGLNDATHWYHEAYQTQNSTGKVNAQGAVCPVPGQDGLTPDQFASAYHLDGLYQSGNQGAGQSIALFELGTWQMSDLSAYTACFGHSRTFVQVIKTGSEPLPISAEGETDAELILGAAPQLDALKIYQAANDDSSYLAEWAQITQDAPAVVASGWNQCELNITPQVVQQEHVFFQLAALQGQTILAAAGAPGNSACPGDNNHTSISTGVVDPAAQPFVTAVGGTALTLNNGSYGYETTWDVSTAGGGLSRYWTLPDWQHMAGVPDPVYSSTSPCAPFTGNSGKYCREVPDVALNADSGHGYWTYCRSGCDGNKPWVVTGGTAAATSLWSVLAALTNELYARAGGSRIGFLNPLLYQVADDPVKYTGSFQHVVVELDEIGQHSQGRYPATIGYNMASGLGSYNALPLATNLIELAQRQATGHEQYTGAYVISLQPRH